MTRKPSLEAPYARGQETAAPWTRPLTDAERNSANIASSVLEDVMRRDPALICEAAAYAIARLWVPHVNGADAEAVCLGILQHIVGRIEALARDHRALLNRATPRT